MHQQMRPVEQAPERVAWVLDASWPEIASMVAAAFGPDDQLIAPGILPGWPSRYRWPFPSSHTAVAATARRHWAMRRVAKSPGALRQQVYLENDRLLAREFAGRIDYRARHLVVAQSWLPWIDECGALGGRTFDVVMSRYPFEAIHRLLDEAAAEIGRSSTIADFRAPTELVARETDLLARARRIFTPHHGIAALFQRQAVKLAWHKPPARQRRVGSRTAFLGPTIARQRPDIARQLAARLTEPLVVFGPIVEPMWDGVPIEPRQLGPNWLDGIGAILHPATLTHEPRGLLEARAGGVTIYATESCGLDPADYLPLERFGSGDTDPKCAPRPVASVA